MDLSFLDEKTNEEIKKYIDDKKDDIKEIAFYLAEKGNLELLKYLVETKKIEVNAKYDKHYEERKIKYNDNRCYTRNEYGEEKTILFSACKNGDLELVKYLVEHGADVNIKMKKYSYWYRYWSYRGKKPEYLPIETLQKYDFQCYDLPYGNIYYSYRDDDVYIEYKYIYNVLTYACNLDKTEIAKYLLIQNVPIEEEFVKCIFKNNKFELVDYIQNINIKIGEYSKTLLMFAVEYNNIGIVKILANKRIDINAKNKYGKTALWFAKKNGNTEIIDYLISVGAKE